MKSIKTILFLVALLINTILHGQSTSVFDANYFDKDNTAPPLKIGKGFHINDVYMQTRACFTPETSKQSNLTSQQTGGKKTTIKVFHTTTNEEYNSFRKRGASGKISFLNLFSFGGQKLEEYANKTIENEERIVFTANVDFGIYSFDTEPQLTDEAKNLIEQKKLQDFVKFFGTHYISGIRKESTINVIITKENSENSNTVSDESSANGSGENPTGAKVSLGVTSTDRINTILKVGKFSAIVEIFGPAIEQSTIKSKITDILNGDNKAKADAIAAIIEGALKNISDPNQSITTQYYYSPFSLYGLDGIYWDEKKQNELTKLNEAIVNVYSSKSRLSEMITESGKKQYLQLISENGADESYTKRFQAAYDKAQPAFINLNTKADSYLKTLEAKYAKCSDVYCPNTNTCCANELYIQEINKFDFSTKIEVEESKLIESILNVAAEMNAPECEKKKMGIITFINYSANPYNLYQGEKLIKTINGKETISFTVALGEYGFKAVQNSGFVMYATINYRKANLTNICEEATLKIGFED